MNSYVEILFCFFKEKNTNAKIYLTPAKTSVEILWAINSVGIQITKTSLPEEGQQYCIYISGATGDVARAVGARLTVFVWGPSGHLLGRVILPEGGGWWIDQRLIHRIQLNVMTSAGLRKFGGVIERGSIVWNSEVDQRH